MNQNYHGRCIGRLIDFLSEYCGEPWAHEVIFQNDCQTITYKSEPFAIYYWYRDTDIPMFTFLTKDPVFWNNCQISFLIEHILSEESRRDLQFTVQVSPK